MRQPIAISMPQIYSIRRDNYNFLSYVLMLLLLTDILEIVLSALCAIYRASLTGGAALQ